jgi:putative hydrolase of the HAD superfamily
MKTIIFDMDDTLLECSQYYNSTKEKFVLYSSERTHIPSDVIERILNDIDLACTTLPDAFGKERFPRSFAAVSSALDIIMGNVVDEEAAEHSYMIGHSVFDAEYPLYENTTEVLTGLKQDYKLILYTKGDYDIQMKKIERNNLLDFFSLDRIYIVGQKTPDTLYPAFLDHNLLPPDAIYVGDSMKDDIKTASQMGICSVLMLHNRSKWAYEDEYVAPDHRINSIEELPELLQRIYLYT